MQCSVVHYTDSLQPQLVLDKKRCFLTVSSLNSVRRVGVESWPRCANEHRGWPMESIRKCSPAKGSCGKKSHKDQSYHMCFTCAKDGFWKSQRTYFGRPKFGDEKIQFRFDETAKGFQHRQSSNPAANSGNWG